MKSRTLNALLLAFSIMQINFSTSAQDSSAGADLIIVNANVRTMERGRPHAEAIAVMGNRIAAVGTNAEIKKLAGTGTRVIDAHGQLVLPGFNDSHVHFIEGGGHLASVQLRDANSPAEFAERIRQFAEKTKPGRWVTGGDWDHERWANPQLPTKELIDKFTPNTPVFVNRLDGHMALANSAALKLAGVTKETPDPPGGLIVRDAVTKEPTGILKDAAMNFVYKVIPDATFDEKLEAARAATDHAASVGVTSVQDMSTGNDVAVYQTLQQRGELKTRVYGARPLPSYETLTRTGIQAPFGSDTIRIGALKGFADGSLGSTTALFFAPYNDAPSTSGLPSDEMSVEGEMLNRVMNADRAGLQVMIHAIGDRANDQILTIYERVENQNGARDRRFRIEHAQHLRAQDIPRFGRDQVIASMQPYHAIDDGRWAEKRIGHDRALTTYAFRALLDSGATLAFGTDWFVAPLNPMLGIYAAVTRRTLDGKNPGGWIPEQKITVEEAVRAYTVGSAYAEFMEKEKGTIAPGKLADIVLLSQDIFAIDPIKIEKTRALLTIMNGRIVYEAPTKE
jgi:predicted amidohydrolase YtcJ